MNKQRILYVDIARIVSCLLVLSYHFALAVGSSLVTADISKYNNWGNLYSPSAVACFIIVSGAMLMYQYSDSGFSIKNFYLKRIKSIFPLFWVAWLIAFINSLSIHKAFPFPNVPKLNFLLTLTGLDGWIATNGAFGIAMHNTFYLVGEWFLGLIIVLYVLFPIFYYAAKKNKYLMPVLLGILTCVFEVYNPLNEVLDTSLIVNAFYFSLGILIYQILSGLSDDKRNRCECILGGIGIIIYVVYLFLPNMLTYCPRRIVFLGGALAIYFASMGLGALLQGKYYSRLAIGKGLEKVISNIAKYTFAVFLLHHFIMLRIIGRFAGANWTGTKLFIAFIAILIIVIIISVIVDYITKKVVKLFNRS